MTTQNLCEIKSHTSSYANMLPSEKKLISDNPSRKEISSASKVARGKEPVRVRGNNIPQKLMRFLHFENRM